MTKLPRGSLCLFYAALNKVHVLSISCSASLMSAHAVPAFYAHSG